MGGIAGYNGNDEGILQAMLNKIRHRGNGDSEVALNDKRFSFGARNLVSEGPSGAVAHKFAGKNYLIALDGEIYNRAELIKKINERARIEPPETDSGLIVRMYAEYGDNLIEMLSGPFSFALYDFERGRLLLVRDRFGIKPLYYCRADGLFMFASELKCFTAHPGFTKIVNNDALADYLSFQYSVAEESFLKNAFKLTPGCFLVFEGGGIAVRRYFEPDFHPEEMTEAEASDMVDHAVSAAVDAHRAASGPDTGAFLSGGVDSGWIAAGFGGSKTFTVGYRDEAYSEVKYAKELSERLGLTHYAETISPERYFECLPKVQYHMDEPLADPASVAFWFACELASKQVGTVYSGEGSDEFFGGYNIYREPLDLAAYSRLPKAFRGFIGNAVSKLPFNVKGKNFLTRGAKAVEERFIGNAFIFGEAERNGMLRVPSDRSPFDVTAPYYAKYSNHDDITKMQLLDINLWMAGDILQNADRMSAAHSLKLRVPYMDDGVFNAAAKLPTRFRVNKSYTKHAFRLAAARKLPEEFAFRKKLGFPVPIRVWLREEKYYETVRSYFQSEAASEYFRKDRLMDLLDAHKRGKADQSRKIWTVFTFLIWHGQLNTL